MPPMPPIPPGGIPPPGISFSSDGLSATTHSVVRISPAILAAFSRAVRTTLVGSTTPAFSKSRIIDTTGLSFPSEAVLLLLYE